jgi:hypothetical protein
MITVMQGYLNVKLKSRAKAENVVRISEESLRNPEPSGGRRGKVSNWSQIDTLAEMLGHSSNTAHPEPFRSAERLRQRSD